MSLTLHYEQIYAAYSARVYRYFANRVGNRWDAEDLTTAVFVKVFAKLDQYNRENPFGAWLFRIAHNTFIDYLRRKKEIPAKEESFGRIAEEEQHQPEQRLLEKEQSARLWELVSALSEDTRQVLALRYQQGLKLAEIAEILGKSHSAVKLLHYRAMKKLQTMITN
ncbi:RNA polymerase sigma factor [Brevibacillus fulvus]|uniref:RNA polymerase sigma-70 factor (ECF subfamily) n=1 Tax=Brevibacillus fulvus TaxID=1125967 RepID=A0A938Y1M2_9BACL|nr:sigma-70 family RNA polymerase sigma factor [Brevibacillus fulvus]MBM7589510.1 RNA polymerase sigma-70 factor (ECF subfamily) [Brevibacillus fulvus]